MTTKKNTIDRKDFMKQVGMGIGAIILTNCLTSCEGGEIPDPSPGVNTDKLDFTLDLNIMANNSLNTLGGFLVVSSSNVIVARTLNDTFLAVTSACTHQGTTINYRSGSDDFRCPNHGSEFSSAGAATNGPATASLTKYKTSFDATANTLRIFE